VLSLLKPEQTAASLRRDLIFFAQYVHIGRKVEDSSVLLILTGYANTATFPSLWFYGEGPHLNWRYMYFVLDRDQGELWAQVALGSPSIRFATRLGLLVLPLSPGSLPPSASAVAGGKRQHSSLAVHDHFNPALRRAARWRSNTAGSLMGIRCLCTSSENLGFSRSTSAASTRASTARPNSL